MATTYPNPHPDGCFWHGVAEVVGAPNIKWCEETLCALVSEPSNTWSNLPYLTFGIWFWLRLRRSPHAELRWMGPAMFLMGLFSFVYHASNNYVSQVFDFIGMYLFVFWLLVINLRRLGVLAHKAQLPTFVALCVGGTALVHGMYVAGLKFQLIVAVSAVTLVATEFMARRREAVRPPIRTFATALVFLALAQTASLLDASRILCDPQSWLQGHAVWHVLAAIGLAFAVRHYESVPGYSIIQFSPTEPGPR